MILFSHPLVKSQKPVIKTFSQDCLCDDFVLVEDKIQAIILNANSAKFIVCKDLNLAIELQSIANDYLFDSKIALIVKNDNELNLAINSRIDAAICEFS